MRARNSIHPDLMGVSSRGVGVGVGEGVEQITAAMVPYPTREQYAKVESDYRRALQEHERKVKEAVAENKPMPNPPVRQPPTMLAAMQRVDLTADARRSILNKIAPPISNLEKKYKIVFNSDARRSPTHTSTNDFTVDVTSDILPTRINGFEIVGYSFPQSEWSIEPYENSIPSRFGWCPTPGARTYGIVSRTFDLNQPPFGPEEAFAYNGVPTSLFVDMPLVRNPVTRVEVRAADSQMPKRVVLYFARRVGSCLAFLLNNFAAVAGQDLSHPFSILELQDVGMQNAVGAYPGRFRLTPNSILDEYQLPYFNTYADEGLLPAEPLLQQRELFAQPAPEEESLYTLTVVAPDFVSYFEDDTEVSTSGDNAVACLGFLHMRPPASAVEVGHLVTTQLRGVLAQRMQLQSLALDRDAAAADRADAVDALRGTLSPIVDLTLFQVKPGNRSARTATQLSSHSHRFRLTAGWVFGNFPLDVPMWYKRSIEVHHIDPAVLDQVVQPIPSTVGDEVATQWGFPKGIPAELVLSENTRCTFACLDPPVMRPEFTTDCNAVPENVSLSEYFQTINTTALSMKFTPNNSSSPFFVIRLETADGTQTDVQVPAGEYRPWPLAVAITTAIRNYPTLRSLRIVVTPSMLDAYGNTAAGFRFASTAPTPQTFNLRFDQVGISADMIQPARLGYRGIAYTGASVYDPKLLNVMDDPYAGFTTPVTFPPPKSATGSPRPCPSCPSSSRHSTTRGCRSHTSATRPSNAPSAPQAATPTSASCPRPASRCP
jgi:hypothetical protein